VALCVEIVCSLDFSSGPILTCRWLRNRSFRSPGFEPTHFGSPGQAPTHAYASDFPSSQAAGESPKRLPSSKRLNSGPRHLHGSCPAIRHHPLGRFPTALGGGENFPRMEGPIWGLRVDLGCQIGSKAGEQIIVGATRRRRGNQRSSVRSGRTWPERRSRYRVLGWPGGPTGSKGHAGRSDPGERRSATNRPWQAKSGGAWRNYRPLTVKVLGATRTTGPAGAITLVSAETRLSRVAGRPRCSNCSRISWMYRGRVA
jgi:hypothetical protein